MTRLLGVVVGLCLLFGSRDASAMTYAQVEAAFNEVMTCSRQMSAVVTDIEKTRNVKARGKSATDSVVPADIAGLVYLDQLLGPKGRPGGVVADCESKYQALLRSGAMNYIPDSWKRPGNTIERGTTSTKSVRLVGGVLQTVPRLRLSAVDTNIANLRKHSSDFLGTVNGLSREALKMVDHTASGPSSTTPRRHFEALGTCASKLATLANAMAEYRRKTFSRKGPNDRVAPRVAVAAANIDEIMNSDGWLDKCRTEHAKMTQAPMSRYLPADFLKPHHGSHALMSGHLGSMRLSGAFLKGTAPQRLAAIDSMIEAFRKASSDFLGRVNYATRHADDQRE